MDAYIYCADIYCEDCGKDIRKRIKSEGHAPANPRDETTYDSDEYPKGPYDDGGGEADTPQHCGSGPHCLNATHYGPDNGDNADDNKSGVFLENPLTSDGYRYVANEHRENPSDITQMWVDFYSPEIEDYMKDNDDKDTWTVHRVVLERCTYSNGILSDNPYHPEMSAWFAPSEDEIKARPQDGRGLAAVADFADIDLDQLRSDLCSDDPVKLALAYQAVGDYHGWENLDQEPLEFTSRKEIEARYATEPNLGDGQPQWKLVAQLGDVNPITYGGYFVYVDKTGHYPPEAELLEVADND